MAGSIYHHNRLVFHDGSVGKKYLIQLNHPSGNEPLLFLKTTSQQKNKPADLGCLKGHNLYFIPSGSSYFFKQDTWVQLYEIYEFKRTEVATNQDITWVGKLSPQQIQEIIDCLFLTQDDDISNFHRKLIRPPLQESLQKLLEKFGKKS